RLRVLFVLSEQEPWRIRRRRPSRDQRRPPGEAGEAAADARDGTEVLPSPGRRELPHGRAAGSRAAGKSAAPGGVDPAASGERRALSGTVFGGRPQRGGPVAAGAVGQAAHLQSIRDLHTRTRCSEEAFGCCRHRERNLLSRAVSPAALLRAPGLPSWPVSERRE